MPIQSSNIPSDISLGEAIGLSPKLPKQDFQGIRYFAGTLAKQQAAKQKAADDADEKYRKYLSDIKVSPDVFHQTQIDNIANEYAKTLGDVEKLHTDNPYSSLNSIDKRVGQFKEYLKEQSIVAKNLKDETALYSAHPELYDEFGKSVMEKVKAGDNSYKTMTDPLGSNIVGGKGTISLHKYANTNIDTEVSRIANNIKGMVADNVASIKNLGGDERMVDEVRSIPKTIAEAKAIEDKYAAQGINITVPSQEGYIRSISSNTDILEKNLHNHRADLYNPETGAWKTDAAGRSFENPDVRKEYLTNKLNEHIAPYFASSVKPKLYNTGESKTNFFNLKAAGEAAKMPHASTTTESYIDKSPEEKTSFIKNNLIGDTIVKSAYDAQDADYKSKNTISDFADQTYENAKTKNPALFSKPVYRIDIHYTTPESQAQVKDWNDGHGGIINGALKGILIDKETGRAYGEIVKDATQIQHEKESKKVSKTTSDKIISSIDYVPLVDDEGIAVNIGRVENERKANRELNTEIGKAEKLYPDAFKNTSSKRTEANPKREEKTVIGTPKTASDFLNKHGRK